MSSCSKLPHEILQCIAQHVNSNTEVPNTRDLKAFQLVCKNWSTPAQEALYQHVRLAENARSFATTITTAPHVGSLVKKLAFLEKFDSNKQHLDEILLAIVRYCVNVKDIHSCFLHQTNNMMEFLSSEDNNIRGLEKLETENHWRRVNPMDYEEIALEYRNTMKHLHLTCELFDDDWSEYRELESKLHLFPVLQQVDLAKYVLKDVEKMNQLLDSCPPSLNALFIEQWWSIKEVITQRQNTITPNTTITKLSIKNARTTSETMHYFAIKLNALKELDAIFTRRTYSTEQEDAWWRHLTSISLGLTRYTFGIHSLSHNREEPGVVQLNRCLDIARKTAPAKCSRHFKLMYCYQTGYDSNMNAILMSRTPNSYHLTIDQRSAQDFYLDDLARSLLQLYMPDSIHLVFEGLDEAYEKLAFTEDPHADSDASMDLDGMSYDFVPAKEIIRALRNVRSEESKISWKAFTLFFVLLLDPLKNHELCVENMVVFQEKSAGIFFVARVSNVTFKNCILEHSILPVLSKHLPMIDCLVFDTSCVLMDEPYNLKLHLPSTKVDALKVIICPLVDALENFCYDYDYLTCKLENKELLEAMSPTGHYTLKIETESKVYISKRQDGRIIEDNCDDVATGTEDNFLIWIKCKELKQCLVTRDRSSNDFQLIK